MKKALLVGLIASFSLILAGCNYPDNSNNDQQNLEKQNENKTVNPVNYEIKEGELVFFWGEGCSHCENVEKFFAENGGSVEKLNLKKIEVFKDLEGQKIFLEKIKECQLSQAGVPVLYKNGKCTQGDTFIIEELKKSL